VTSRSPAYKSGRSKLSTSLAFEFLDEENVFQKYEFKEEESERYIVRVVQNLRLKIALNIALEIAFIRLL